jgi:hypothetical protein
MMADLIEPIEQWQEGSAERAEQRTLSEMETLLYILVVGR